MRRLGWLGDRHLSEAALIARYVKTGHGGAASAPNDAHLAACERCARRFAALGAFLDDIGMTATAAADEAFTPERLLAQHRRVMRRVSRLLARNGPARVLLFPAAGRIAPLIQRGARRWVAAAAVAGLLAGLVTGRVVHPRGTPPTGADSEARSGDQNLALSRVPTAAAPAAVDAEPPRLSSSDETLLFEIEEALDAPHVEELLAIDAMTPQVRSVALSIR